MEVQISVAKINKYATSESGDTLELVERPGGGLSIVLADGQSSGRGAKRVSNLVVRKVISLLAEGVRDGAAARAASDYLYHERHGKVSATLNILSVDLDARSLVISRNNPSPVFIAHGQQIEALDENSIPIGIYRNTRPVISHLSLDAGLTALTFTDGLIHAGSRTGTPLDIMVSFQDLLSIPHLTPQDLADRLLEEALALDQGRPVDDISVVILHVTRRTGDAVRRLTARLPIDQ